MGMSEAQSVYFLAPSSLMPCRLNQPSSFELHIWQPHNFLLQGSIGGIHWTYNLSNNILTVPNQRFNLQVNRLNQTAFLINASFDPIYEGQPVTISAVNTRSNQHHILYSEYLAFHRELRVLKPTNDSAVNVDGHVTVIYTATQPSKQEANIDFPCGELLKSTESLNNRKSFRTGWSVTFRLSRSCPYKVWITINLQSVREHVAEYSKSILIYVNITATSVDIHGPEIMYLTQQHNQLQCESDNRPALPVHWYVTPLPVYLNKDIIPSHIKLDGERLDNYLPFPSTAILPSMWLSSSQRKNVLLLQNYVGSDLTKQPARGWGSVGYQIEFNVTCFVKLDNPDKPTWLSSSRIITVFTHSNQSYEKNLELATYVLSGITTISILSLIVIACRNRRSWRRASREQSFSFQKNGAPLYPDASSWKHETNEPILLHQQSIPLFSQTQDHEKSKKFSSRGSQLKIDPV